MTKVKILLNGEDFHVKQGLTLANLIENLELDIKKVAVEKNLEIVNCEDFTIDIINEGDQIEIVHFIGGG